MDARHAGSGEESGAPRHTWLVTNGRAYRLDHAGLPERASRHQWTIVDAGHEDEALRRAEEYRRRREP